MLGYALFLPFSLLISFLLTFFLGIMDNGHCHTSIALTLTITPHFSTQLDIIPAVSHRKQPIAPSSAAAVDGGGANVDSSGAWVKGVPTQTEGAWGVNVDGSRGMGARGANTN